jgi:site-specific DNA-cytosine methylase
MKNKRSNNIFLSEGISCGQVALQRAGIKVNNYFASEIDKHAIKVTQSNHPNTKQIGDVTKTKGSDLPKIDLLIGGSPCQGFSFSGKQLNFDDPRSKLFFEFVRLLNEVKPKYWLLENVVMKQEYQDVISQHLGVEPVKLNSALTSAQNRVRLYWANFDITEPTDKGIGLEDVLEDTEMIGPSAIRGRRLNKATILGRRLDERGKRQDYDKNVPITQCLEVRASNRDKSNCLTTVAKDTVLTTMEIGRHPDAFNRKLPFRNYTKIERCRLMNLPDNYCDEISDNQTVKATGNGWEVGMITHIFNQMAAITDKERGEEKNIITAYMHEPSSEVYLEDCVMALKRFADNYFDLAIVDPPYGINADIKNNGKNSDTHEKTSLAKINTYKKTNWDNETPNEDYFNELKRVSKKQIIWGANFFGLVGGMLYWHKGVTMPTYSTGELAWLSWLQKIDFVNITWHGMLQHNMKDKEQRIHPTQKPVALYDWLLSNYAKEGDLILDTHLGSGSSRIAAYKGGFNFVGFEIDKEYYEKQEKRFNDFKSQLRLF